jgi:hypothetical protein
MIELDPNLLREKLIKIIEDNPDTVLSYSRTIGFPRPATLSDFLSDKVKPTFLTMLRIKKFIKEWDESNEN